MPFAGDTPSVKIATMTLGDAKNDCFLVCPGSGATKHGNLWFSRDLAERGYYVIMFDPRDIGESQKFVEGAPADPMAEFMKCDPGHATLQKAAGEEGKDETPIQYMCYNMEDMLADMAKILDDHGVERCFVMGHSGGGGFAQYFAAHYPHRVRGAVVSGCGFDMDSAHMREANESPAGKKLAEHMAKFPPPAAGSCTREEYIEQIALNMSGILLNSGEFGKPCELYREIAALDWDTGCVGDPMGGLRQGLAWVEFMNTGGPARAQELAAKSETPCLVIHGEQDPTMPFSQGKRVAAGWKNGQFVDHPYGHNYGPPETQAMILDKIEEFCKKN